MNATLTTPRILRLPAIALVAIFAFSFAGRVMAQKAQPQVQIQTQFAPVTKAQSQSLGVAFDDCWCWIDAKTGKQVPTIPRAAVYVGDAVAAGFRTKELKLEPQTDDNHISNPQTGQNFVQLSGGCWIDAKTGKQVPTIPRAAVYVGDAVAAGFRTKELKLEPQTDDNYISNPQTGQNFVRVPCPPPPATKTTQPPPPVEHASSGVPPRFELDLGYVHMRPTDEVVKSLNGFTVSAFCNVTPLLEAPVNLSVTPRVTSEGVIKLELGVEFSGLYGTENQGFGGSATSFSEKTWLDRYLYMFGPQVTCHPCEHAGIFGHVLVGGVHDENKVTQTEIFGSTVNHSSTHTSADALALDVGAGFDIQVSPHISIGPSFDYVPTHFTSSSGKHWQNNLMIFVRATIVSW
jgi:hypothetical protein